MKITTLKQALEAAVQRVGADRPYFEDLAVESSVSYWFSPLDSLPEGSPCYEVMKESGDVIKRTIGDMGRLDVLWSDFDGHTVNLQGTQAATI